MQRRWLVILALCLGTGWVAAASDDGCHRMPAHDEVLITDGGSVENPAGRDGWPSRPGCKLAYVVDFVSPDRRMSSFRPDRHWIKEMPPGVGCFESCGGQTLFKYTGTIELLPCATAEDCAADRFGEAVGTFQVVYRRLLGENRCAPTAEVGSVPTARDVHGVRMVLRYRVIEGRLDENGNCETHNFPLGSPLEFNLSGTAGFPTVDTEGGRRFDAVPADP